MAKYSAKSITLTYETVKTSEEERQTRINEAFDILFEETLNYLAGAQDHLIQSMKGGDRNEKKF